jgi:hypothetical protein
LEAGFREQSRRAIAIGTSAGAGLGASPLRSQGEGSVCIGFASGYRGVGANTIAIGPQCCSTSAITNSIVFSAAATAFNPATNGFFVNPANIVVGATGNALTFNNTTGEIVKASSSLRYKKDIEELNKDTSVLHQFKPVEFRYLTEDETRPKAFGFIAEDMDLIDKNLVVYNEEGEPDGIYWDKINTYNICEVQKLRKEIDEMKLLISTLTQQINILKGT